MERRREPRFEVSSPVRVIVPGEPTRMFSAQLIDISATGMRFLSAENIEENKIAGIEVDHRLILAEIRHVETRGNKYVVGARRLHEISKDAALGDAAGVVSRMLGDFHRHITDGQKFDSDAVVLAAMEKIMEGKEPDESEAFAPPSMTEPSPIAAVAEPPSPAPIAAPQQVMAAEEVLEEKAGPQTLAPPPAEEAVKPAPTPAPMMAGSAHPRVVDVTPTRVDPVEAARASAVTTIETMQKSIPQAGRSERWTLLLALAAGLVFAVIGALVIERWMQASPAPPRPHVTAAAAPASAPAAEPPSVAPSPSPAPAAEPSATAPSPAPAASAAPPTTSAPSAVQHAQIRAKDQTWISIIVDGRAGFKGLLQRGDVREFEFTNDSAVVVGDGDNTALTLNGSPVRLGSGAWKVRLTPSGAKSHRAH
jgi:hypothetical protein